jgi:hypothetical protein
MAGTDPRIKSGDGHDGGQSAFPRIAFSRQAFAKSVLAH